MTSDFSSLNPLAKLARRLACNRREFLRNAAGLALGSALLRPSAMARAVAPRKKRKVVVITFGGGARDQETFAPEGQENIPHLMRELIPQSSFLYPSGESRNPGPLCGHGQPGHRSLRDLQ